jgi:hypothetical protein
MMLWTLCLGIASAPVGYCGEIREHYTDEIRRSKYDRLFDAVGTPGTDGATRTLYVLVGDISDFLVSPEHLTDALIISTNTDFNLDAPNPPAQSIFVKRLAKAERERTEAEIEKFHRTVGTRAQILENWIAVELRDQPTGVRSMLPRYACLLATDYPQGGTGSMDYLRPQSKIRYGVEGCMRELQRFGAKTVVMPLVGAATVGVIQSKPILGGEEHLNLRCRIMNSILGIASGVRAAWMVGNLPQEVGVVIWDREARRLFGTNPSPSQIVMLNDFSSQLKRYLQDVVEDGKAVTIPDCPDPKPPGSG